MIYSLNGNDWKLIWVLPSEWIWRKLWEQVGATSAWDRARDAAHRILAEHRPQVLDPLCDQWIQERFANQLLL